MKNTFFNNVIFLATCAFFITSCTEVIDIDLNSSDPEIVIEGNISNNGESAVVKITESINFDESNDFTNVENALVTLNDDMGNSEILVEMSPGIYSSNSLIGTIGNTYFLIVEAKGNTLTSQSIIPNRVAFDSLIIEESTEDGFGFGGSSDNSLSYNITVSYKDPIAEKNYYRFVEYINGEYKGGYVFDDRLSNGLTVTNNLQMADSGLDIGDTLQIVMQCIDQEVYEYFHSFGNLAGGPQNSSTPANPITNIEGGVLGYFSAHTEEVRQVVIQ